MGRYAGYDAAAPNSNSDKLDGYHASAFVMVGTTRVVTATTTELAGDGLIVCNKVTVMTVNLLAASGSNRVLEIANINDGLVTVTPNGADTIDGDVSQTIYRNSCMVIKDYAANKFIII